MALYFIAGHSFLYSDNKQEWLEDFRDGFDEDCPTTPMLLGEIQTFSMDESLKHYVIEDNPKLFADWVKKNYPELGFQKVIGVDYITFLVMMDKNKILGVDRGIFPFFGINSGSKAVSSDYMDEEDTLIFCIPSQIIAFMQEYNYHYFSIKYEDYRLYYVRDPQNALHLINCENITRV